MQASPRRKSGKGFIYPQQVSRSKDRRRIALFRELISSSRAGTLPSVLGGKQYIHNHVHLADIIKGAEETQVEASLTEGHTSYDLRFKS